MKIETNQFPLLLTATAIIISLIPQVTVAEIYDNRLTPSNILGRSNNTVPQCLSDLKADRFSFQILERRSKYQAKVRITGIVTKQNNNVYTTTSASSPTKITLYREGPRVALKSVDIHRITEKSYSLSYDQEWDTTSPAEGEFPWTFYLSINNENKGCDYNNNGVNWISAPINEHLRRTAGN